MNAVQDYVIQTRSALIHTATLFVNVNKVISGGSKWGGGGRLEGRAPLGSKFFQFHADFGKIWQNRMLAPPGELAPPPRGNPGSATGNTHRGKFAALHLYTYVLVHKFMGHLWVQNLVWGRGVVG